MGLSLWTWISWLSLESWQLICAKWPDASCDAKQGKHCLHFIFSWTFDWIVVSLFSWTLYWSLRLLQETSSSCWVSLGTWIIPHWPQSLCIHSLWNINIKVWRRCRQHRWGELQRLLPNPNALVAFSALTLLKVKKVKVGFLCSATYTANQNSALHNLGSGSWLARASGAAAPCGLSTARANVHWTCGCSQRTHHRPNQTHQAFTLVSFRQVSPLQPK